MERAGSDEAMLNARQHVAPDDESFASGVTREPGIMRRAFFPPFKHKPPRASEIIRGLPRVVLFGILLGPFISF